MSIRTKRSVRLETPASHLTVLCQKCGKNEILRKYAKAVDNTCATCRSLGVRVKL